MFPPGFLNELDREGEILVPVDPGGMQKVRQAGLRYVLPEDWLGVEATLAARRAADDWEARWFAPARDSLSSDGICWPLFDKEALNWYWRDVSLADALVRACRKRCVAQVRLVVNRPLRPALGYQRSDVHGELIRSSLEERVAVHETGHDPWPAILSPAIALDRLRSGAETVSAERIAGQIVLALNPGEFHRFTPVIRELGQRFSNRVTVVALWPSPAETAALARSCPVAVFTPALAPAVDPDEGRHFFAGYLQAAAAAKEAPWAEALARTRFQFEYYCGLRLPVLAANFRAWANLFASHPPAAVVTSSLPDAEAQLPALAADRAGIPTVSLPHGGFGAREQDCHARTVLYNCEPTRRVYVAAGIAPQRLRSCREVISENEYPTRTGVAFGRNETGRILVLTNPVKFDTCLFNTTMIGSQMRALRDVAQVPALLAGRIDLAVKTHPSRHDRPLFELADEDFARRMLPPDLPLEDALARADLVVALNYPGTALIYTLRARKPVIFFWNDPLLLRRSHSYRHAHLMLDAGDFVETGEALWQAVDRFFTDSAYAALLRDRADTFARANLDTDSCPSLADIIGEFAPSEPSDPKGPDAMPSRPDCRSVESLIANLKDIFVDTRGYIFEYGGMPVEELRILCGLIRSRKPRTIFEIGTFKGGTTRYMAANTSGRVITLDLPPKGHREHISPAMNDPELDVYPDFPGIRFRGSPVAERIEQILADSQTFDYSPYYGKIDLVFVDACHHYEFVLRDSMNAFKMVSPGGMIVWHDYADYAPGVMKALETVSARFPLVHIAGTSLAFYADEGNRDARELLSSTGLAPAAAAAVNGEALLARIARNPEDTDALVGLARLSAAEGFGEEAAAFVRDALIIDPHHPLAMVLQTETAG